MTPKLNFGCRFAFEKLQDKTLKWQRTMVSVEKNRSLQSPTLKVRNANLTVHYKATIMNTDTSLV